MGRGILIAFGVTATVAGAVVLIAKPDATKNVVQLGRHAGLLDEPPPPPESFDLVVDVSEGSSGGVRENVEQTIGVILERMSATPGSVLRVIAQGARVANAAVVSMVQSTTPTRNNQKARAAHAKRFIATSHELLMKAMEPVFAASPLVWQSPIAETIQWAALLSLPPGLPPGTARHIIVISDTHEATKEFGDFACGPLPSPPEFIKRLHGRDVLMPKSLEGIRIHFTFTEPHASPRRTCPPMTIARINAIRMLWTAAMKRANAAETTFETGVVTFRTHAEQGDDHVSIP